MTEPDVWADYYRKMEEEAAAAAEAERLRARAEKVAGRRKEKRKTVQAAKRAERQKAAVAAAAQRRARRKRNRRRRCRAGKKRAAKRAATPRVWPANGEEPEQLRRFERWLRATVQAVESEERARHSMEQKRQQKRRRQRRERRKARKAAVSDSASRVAASASSPVDFAASSAVAVSASSPVTASASSPVAVAASSPVSLKAALAPRACDVLSTAFSVPSSLEAALQPCVAASVLLAAFCHMSSVAAALHQCAPAAGSQEEQSRRSSAASDEAPVDVQEMNETDWPETSDEAPVDVQEMDETDWPETAPPQASEEPERQFFLKSCCGQTRALKMAHEWTVGALRALVAHDVNIDPADIRLTLRGLYDLSDDNVLAARIVPCGATVEALPRQVGGARAAKATDQAGKAPKDRSTTISGLGLDGYVGFSAEPLANDLFKQAISAEVEKEVRSSRTLLLCLNMTLHLWLQRMRDNGFRSFSAAHFSRILGYEKTAGNFGDGLARVLASDTRSSDSEALTPELVAAAVDVRALFRSEQGPAPIDAPIGAPKRSREEALNKFLSSYRDGNIEMCESLIETARSCGIAIRNHLKADAVRAMKRTCKQRALEALRMNNLQIPEKV